MRKHTFYLAIQLAKYRTMTSSQIKESLPSICRSNFYANLATLKKLGYAQRVSHDLNPQYGYIARPELDEALGRELDGGNRPLRIQDLRHSFCVTEVMMELARYSFIRALSHESELSSDAITNFCPRRRPDAIIQVSRDQFSAEIAIEVELTNRAPERIREVFSIYRENVTDERLHCSGVIFVVYPSCNVEIYNEERAKLPKSIQGKIIVRTPAELKTLNPEFFGTRSSSYGLEIGFKARMDRTLSNRGVQYLPIIPENADFVMPLIPTQVGGQS